jgi:hypothetical protein
MRVAVVRSDLSKLYLADVENSSQRCFSSEPQGQSRYFSKPSDSALQSVLNTYGLVTVRGSDMAATVDTTVANGTKLNIKASATAAFVQVTVSSNAALPKATVVSELNAGFVAAGLPLVARLSGTNQVTIDTIQGGSGAYIAISAASPSAGALHTVLGLAAAATTPVSLVALKAVVYPTATSIDVSAATINALGTWGLLSTAAQDALDEAVADLVAPSLVETGPVLLSYVYGNLSKLRSASFQPGGARVGLPSGPAVAVVENDGSTPFTV